MIAKAATISHGGNAVRYSVNKDKAEIVKVNFLPDDISAEAMYQRMVFKQKEFASTINKGRPLKRNVIRMEISPTKEESAGWTLDDWVRLANEYIQLFDSIDLSKKTKRTSAKSTNVKNSQYVVALHHDAKSGIPHLHIEVNRVDMDGKVNDDHLIAERAMSAAYIINERRGWVQPEDIYEKRRQEITNTCMDVLRSLPNFSRPGYETGLKAHGYGIHLREVTFAPLGEFLSITLKLENDSISIQGDISDAALPQSTLEFYNTASRSDVQSLYEQLASLLTRM